MPCSTCGLLYGCLCCLSIAKAWVLYTTPGVARSWGLSGLGYRERQQPESKDLLKWSSKVWQSVGRTGRWPFWYVRIGGAEELTSVWILRVEHKPFRGSLRLGIRSYSFGLEPHVNYRWSLCGAYVHIHIDIHAGAHIDIGGFTWTLHVVLRSLHYKLMPCNVLQLQVIQCSGTWYFMCNNVS